MTREEKIQTFTKIRVESSQDLAYDSQKLQSRDFQKYLKQGEGSTPPLYHPDGLIFTPREDVALPTFSQDQALKNAKKTKRGCFTTPKPF
ncbi:MAG: Asp-tRNA(Asn)/Glu-tRNA(Gln) amidotransferase subunit GatC [Candidatus Dojkabacteria bacterium]